MLRNRLAAMLLVPGFCAGYALAADAAARRFAGTWEAKFKDKVICSMRLEAGESVSGELKDCQISVNADGDLVEPDTSEEPDHKPEPILEPKVQDDILSFSVEDEPGKPLKFEFKLTGEGHADLTFVDAPARIKPIAFVKK